MSHYITLTNNLAKNLWLLDSFDAETAYQDFCNIIKKVTKKTISFDHGKNCIPCWDAEYESLYRMFLQFPQGDRSSLAATTLLCQQRGRVVKAPDS